MANFHHARLPGRVDWPTLAAILERDLGLQAVPAATDTESGRLDIDRAGTGLTSALFFKWPEHAPQVTEPTMREGGPALEILIAPASVTAGEVASSDEHMDRFMVPISKRPPWNCPGRPGLPQASNGSSPSPRPYHSRRHAPTPGRWTACATCSRGIRRRPEGRHLRGAQPGTQAPALKIPTPPEFHRRTSRSREVATRGRDHDMGDTRRWKPHAAGRNAVMVEQSSNHKRPARHPDPSHIRLHSATPLRQVGMGALCTAGLAAALLVGVALMAGLVILTVLGIVIALAVAGALLQAALARSEDPKERWRRT